MEARIDATTSTVELVSRVAASGQDRAAESEVCRRFAPRIRLYGLKHLRDEERARDLVQLVLLAVIEAMRAGRISEPEHLDRFVLGTCRHIAGRVRSREYKLEPTEREQLERIESDLVRAGASTMLEPLDVKALLRCLKGLESRARDVVHLSFYRDLAADEIGGLLEMTSANVRVVRHRAMAQLRDCMGLGEGRAA